MITCSFQNVLWSPDLVTWLWLTQSLSCLLLRCILGCLKCVGNLFPTQGYHNTAHIRNMKGIGNFNRNSTSSRCIHYILKSASSNGINGRGIAKMNWNTLLEWSIYVIIEMTIMRAKMIDSTWVKEGIIFACFCKESDNFSSNYDMSRKRGMSQKSDY